MDNSLIKRQDAINALIEWVTKLFDDRSVVDVINEVPSAQPELIEKEAYIRGFEQGRTQGMIDAQGEKK